MTKPQKEVAMGLEARVAALEVEVARLRARLEASEPPKDEGLSKPWWRKIAGTFEGDPYFAEAMRLLIHSRVASMATPNILQFD